MQIDFYSQEMVKDRKLIFSFDSTKKARFGVLPRYAKNELQIQWFELPNCFIFHNGELLSRFHVDLSIDVLKAHEWDP